MKSPKLQGRAARAGSSRSSTLTVDASVHAHSLERDGVRVALVGLPYWTAGTTAVHDGAAIVAAVAASFRSRGIALLDDLHGSFALAAVDTATGRALLAVDRLGISPMCHAHDGADLVFDSDASRLADTLRGGHALDADATGGLDPQGVFDYLYSHCVPGPATIYRGVSRLLPGHAVVFDAGTAKTVAYWSSRYDERGGVAVERLESEFLETVEASVARAIDGAARPGCFLSGGTDSSTVAGMLAKVTGRPAEAYSIGFEAEGFDEMEYARIAARHFDVRHHEYYITPADLVRSIPEIAAAYDQPFGNSSVLPTYYCAKIAAADGIDRMLGGDGGDELFGGNTRYAKQRVFGYFDALPGPARSALRGLLAPAPLARVPVVGKARSYVAQASVPMPDRMQTYNLLTRIGLDTIFEPAFLARVDVDAPARAMRDWYARCDTPSLVNRMLAFDLKFTLTDNDLPKVVTACTLAGVDVAFPFLDDAVVAFSERLEPDLKLKGLKLRWFFKHALRDFLPAEILTKSKHGFGLPFGIWLSRDPALHALAFSSLEALKGRGIVRAAFIDELGAKLLSQHASYYGELVWVLMMLEHWLASRSVT